MNLNTIRFLINIYTKKGKLEDKKKPNYLIKRYK